MKLSCYTLPAFTPFSEGKTWNFRFIIEEISCVEVKLDSFVSQGLGSFPQGQNTCMKNCTTNVISKYQRGCPQKAPSWGKSHFIPLHKLN